MEKQQSEEVAEIDCRQQPTSPANKSPVFYRMIVPSVIQENKLRIPENFVKKLGSEIPSVATLTTPNGCSWQVGLTKIEDKVWFDNGWHEFVAHQSIRVGYLLVFAYTENSNFKVSMYDLANAEVNYHCNTPRSSCPVLEEDDDSVEILDRSTRRQTLRKHKKGSRSTQSLGVETNESEHKVKLNSSNQRPGTARKRRRGRGLDGYESSAKRGTEEQTPRTRTNRGAVSRQHREIAPGRKEKVLNDSKAFQSDNPFCRIVMRPSYFIKGISLHIPVPFAAKYLEGISDYITLQGSGTEKWQVLCTWRDGTAKFSKGWYEFVCDNCLKEDDVCVFELIDTEKFVFKVNFFRVSEDDESAKKLAMDLLFGRNGAD